MRFYLIYYNMIIAHRGNNGNDKENTVLALLNSLNLSYCDGVEFDIRETKDGIFIISHDMFYGGKIIYNTLFDDLKGAQRLDDLLKNIRSDKVVMIEIKEERINFPLVLHLYKVIKRYNLNYYIMSFNYALITDFKKRYPRYKCGLLIGIKMNNSRFINDLDFNAINIKHVEKARAEDFVWTINDTKNLKDIHSSIITDKPLVIYNAIHGER